VATHISRYIHARGHAIACIWSRDIGHARRLAALVDSRGISVLEEVPRDADFGLLAVPDRAIPTVASGLQGREGIWMHMSGAVPMDVLEPYFGLFGVFYPLQTFSGESEPDLDTTPLLVEGSSPATLDRILRLAGSLSATVAEADSKQRLIIHTAAVFANNFSNHMVHIAARILEEHGADFGLLEPILRETFRKMISSGPSEAQTGPALRGDWETMEKHLELLKAYPEWQKIYTFVSRDIRNSRNKQQ
jgi:predicted short-subunit dehydrogenase-like oxidoreductase (DUF2520 family)